MLYFLESLLLFRQIFDKVVDVVLDQNGNHGMGSHSEIKSWQTNPQIKETLVSHALNKTVNNVLIRKHSLSIYVTTAILGFIFKILVLTLSNGRDPTDAVMPAMADPKSLIKVVSLVSFKYFCNSSLTWL